MQYGKLTKHTACMTFFLVGASQTSFYLCIIAWTLLYIFMHGHAVSFLCRWSHGGSDQVFISQPQASAPSVLCYLFCCGPHALSTTSHCTQGLEGREKGGKGRGPHALSTTSHCTQGLIKVGGSEGRGGGPHALSATSHCAQGLEGREKGGGGGGRMHCLQPPIVHRDFNVGRREGRGGATCNLPLFTGT